MQRVLTDVLVGKQTSVAKPSVDIEPCANAVDELAIEETRAYTAKIGRWRRDCLAVISDQTFWVMIRLQLASRAPCVRLSAFLQKAIPDSTLDELGGHMAQLVDGKAKTIAGDFERLLATRFWEPIVGVMGDPCDVAWLTQLAISLTLHYAAGFDRRVCAETHKRTP